MNTIQVNQTRTLRRVGDLNKKFVALFLSVLLAIMCLPILPGNVEEAHAETAQGPVTITTATQNPGLYTSSVKDIMHGPGNGWGSSSATNFLFTHTHRIENWDQIWDETYGGPWTPGAHTNVSDGWGTITGGYWQVPVPWATPAENGATYTFSLKSAKPITFSDGTNSVTWPIGSIFTMSLDGSTYAQYGIKMGFTWQVTWRDPTGATIYSYNNTNGYNSGMYNQHMADFPSITSYTTTTNVYHNPVVTAHPDLIKTIGDTAGVSSWAENITATWGYTTSKTIPSLGAITDDTLVGGTDPDLSTTGTIFDQVGVKTHNYTIKDDHSLDTVTPLYSGDSTFANTMRNIIVMAASAPQFDIVYAAGAVDENGALIAGTPYNGEWTNQKLDMNASHTDPGTYDTVIRKYDAPTPSSTFNNQAIDTANVHAVSSLNYGTESPDTTGNDFTSILQKEDPLSLGTYIDLSPESAKKNVKIDNTKPSPAASFASNVFTDTSTDALSGINAAKQKIALVPTTYSAPNPSDYESFASLNASLPAPGVYDAYVWGMG